MREMKDSGIEWIGQIPKNWEIGKLKYFTTKIGSGKTPKGGAEVYSDEGVLFLRSQNIYDDGLKLDETSYISDEIDNEMSSTRVYYNDILLNITGGSIGRCCVYDDEKNHANVNQHVCIIRCDNRYLPEYVHYFWISSAGHTSINIYQTGANREGMNFEQIGNTQIPILSLNEQKQIVSYLDRKCTEIDNTINKKQAVTDKLI